MTRGPNYAFERAEIQGHVVPRARRYSAPAFCDAPQPQPAPACQHEDHLLTIPSFDEYFPEFRCSTLGSTWVVVLSVLVHTDGTDDGSTVQSAEGNPPEVKECAIRMSQARILNAKFVPPPNECRKMVHVRAVNSHGA